MVIARRPWAVNWPLSAIHCLPSTGHCPPASVHRPAATAHRPPATQSHSQHVPIHLGGRRMRPGHIGTDQPHRPDGRQTQTRPQTDTGQTTDQIWCKTAGSNLPRVGHERRLRQARPTAHRAGPGRQSDGTDSWVRSTAAGWRRLAQNSIS